MAGEIRTMEMVGGREDQNSICSISVNDSLKELNQEGLEKSMIHAVQGEELGNFLPLFWPW